MPLVTFSAHDTARSADVNANFALCVLTDTVRTVTVTHTWTARQTMAGIDTSDTVLVTSASANALAVGLAGATNPALQVDASTASSATGLKVKSAAAAGGVALSVISSGTDENLKIDAKGAGTITLQGTATGAVILGVGQLTFPATQNASSNANTLDDYEEGTCTLTTGGTSTYTTQVGRYIKIGKMVTVWWDVRVNVLGTGSISTLSGLPFAAASASLSYAGAIFSWISLARNVVWVGCKAVVNTSTITFSYVDAAAASSSVLSDWGQNNAGFVGCITYEAAA